MKSIKSTENRKYSELCLKIYYNLIYCPEENLKQFKGKNAEPKCRGLAKIVEFW